MTCQTGAFVWRRYSEINWRHDRHFRPVHKIVQFPCIIIFLLLIQVNINQVYQYEYQSGISIWISIRYINMNINITDRSCFYLFLYHSSSLFPFLFITSVVLVLSSHTVVAVSYLSVVLCLFHFQMDFPLYISYWSWFHSQVQHFKKLPNVDIIHWIWNPNNK